MGAKALRDVLLDLSIKTMTYEVMIPAMSRNACR